MLQTQDLKYQYSGGEKLVFPNILLQRGEDLLVLGPSGKGKSTLLHLLAGFLKPLSGKILIGDTDLTSLSGRRSDKFRAANIGLVFQQPHFLKALKVRENLLIASQLAAKSNSGNRIDALLAELGLSDKSHRYPNNLSSGEQQRLSIIRAVINQPQIILADEPTSALDDENTVKVVNLLLQSARESQASLIVVTHDQRLKSYFKKEVNL